MLDIFSYCCITYCLYQKVFGHSVVIHLSNTGVDPGFQARGGGGGWGGGGSLKKMHRTEGGAKIVGVFRVKNHDFTPKNHILSNFKGRRVRLPLYLPLE